MSDKPQTAHFPERIYLSYEDVVSRGRFHGAGSTKWVRADMVRQLEAERDALQARIAQLEESALGGYEDGWHALRNERDALRARIEDAPVCLPVEWDLDELTITLLIPSSYKPQDKRVALVLLGGDE